MRESCLLLAGFLALFVFIAGCSGGEQSPANGGGSSDSGSQGAGPATLTVNAFAGGEAVNATVYLNGSFYGITPLTLLDVEPGAYLVTVNASGFAPNVTKISVLEGGKVSFNAVLLPLAGKAFLNVQASQSEATVTVNGVNRGFAPLNLTLDAGNITVMVSKNGYVDETRVFNLQPGETKNFLANLVPL